MDTTQYLDVFIDESMEHLDVLYNQLLALERSPSNKEVIEEIFRAAHTIKGMSATMGFEDVANLTHNLENVLDGIRNDDISVHTQTIDIMFEAVDHLNAMVDNIASGGDGKRNVKQVLEHLEQLETGNQIVFQEVSHNSLATNEEQTINKLDQFEMTILDESIEQGYKNYEIYVQIRNDCLLKGVRVFMVFEALEQFGEVIKSEPPVVDLEEEKFEDSFVVLLVTKSSADEIRKTITQISEIEKVSVNPFSLSDYRTEQNKHHQEYEIEDQDKTEQKSSSTSVRQAAPRKTIRVNIERLDALMNLFEELVIDRGRLEQIATEINHTDLRETVDHMTRISGDLQDVILNMRMVPISQVFNRFPGMVRQISRDLNKKINLEIIGAETELDRTVIDEIGDPLVHLIRNAADHGIELPEERRKKGKPDQGTIKLVAYHSGNFVFIEIEDDGAGINKKVVLDKAIKNGVVSTEQSKTLSDEQIYELMMDSGFSTTESVSDLSGRGVGLDVVKNTIETLGGSISIDSKIDQGSKFSIQLPLTLSIISVLLVEVQAEKYAIPLSSIVETINIPQSEIIEVHKNKVIDYRGKVVSLVYLDKVFSVPKVRERTNTVSIVIVQRGNNLAAFVVDSFISQQEVVIKSLGNYLTNIPAIAGATILGDGEVALIIDSNALI